MAGPGKKRFEDMLKGIDSKVAKVGWLDGMRYENGLPVAYVAAIQEYGDPSKNIPPRPSMRITIAERELEWKDVVKNSASLMVKGKISPDQALGQIGSVAAGHLRETISALLDPPLKPATIAARLKRRANGKFVGNLYKPLIDSGLMLSTVTYKVENSE